MKKEIEKGKGTKKRKIRCNDEPNT